jgi:hypothetical protein
VVQSCCFVAEESLPSQPLLLKLAVQAYSSGASKCRTDGRPTQTHPNRSDNGLCDAQKFYGRLRPLEGRMKGGVVASKTTAAGARFDSPLAKAATMAARG